MNTNDNRRFKKGSGVYKCIHCQHETRETGQGESQFEMCAPCFEISSIENMHSDDDHEGEVYGCLECRSLMTPKALAHLGVFYKGNIQQADMPRITKNSEIKNFWLVTKPTRLSVMVDICFETDIQGLAQQVKGGLKAEEIHGMYTDEQEARRIAQGLLDSRTQ